MQEKVKHVPLRSYIGMFLLACIVSQCVIVLFSIMAGTTFRASGFVAAMIAALWVSEKFVEQQGRAFLRGEKWRMVLFSLLGLMGISLVLTGIMIAPAYAVSVGYLDPHRLPPLVQSFGMIGASQGFADFLKGVNPLVASYVIGLLMLLYMAVLYIVYSLFPPRLVRKRQARQSLEERE